MEGGTIEAQTSIYGLKRMHFVEDSGRERVLVPEPLSAEGRRAQLAVRSPGLSRVIGVAAVGILLVLVAVAAMQIAGVVTLPGWANTAATVLGVTAAMERALTLRSHWLVDIDTTWFGD